MTAAPDHGQRDHATWSASSTAANWACTGRLALIAEVNAPDKESEAAAWGTACHQISEMCLKGSLDPVDFIGRIIKTKEHEFEVDEEMAETAREYVEYVRTASLVATQVWIEERFTLDALNPPFDAGGTCDTTIYTADLKLLEVVDLKGGRGVVVEAKGNPQGRTYALGAMLAHPGLDVERVQVTIVQPRAPHKDGRIRTDIFHVTELSEWTFDLVGKMLEAKDAIVAREQSASFDEWWPAYLKAGDHCTFCPPGECGRCPALEKASLDLAKAFFTPEPEGQLVIAADPNEMTPEQLAHTLDGLDMLENWIDGVRNRAHHMAESGVSIPDYELVEKTSRRKWKDLDAALAALRDDLYLTDDKLYTKKLMSPAQVERVIGAKRKAEIKNLWHTQVTGTNLVRKGKSVRVAVAPAVNRHFTAISGDV